MGGPEEIFEFVGFRIRIGFQGMVHRLRIQTYLISVVFGILIPIFVVQVPPYSYFPVLALSLHVSPSMGSLCLLGYF